MAMSYRLLALIARLHPEVWDVIPRGPQSGLERRALNPQPLPPVARIQLAAVEASHDVVRAAFIAEAIGQGGGARVIERAVADWCGNEPRKIPIPIPWPWPRWDLAELRGDEEVAVSVQTVGALMLASVAEALDEGDLRSALEAGAETLGDAAVRSAS